MFFTIKFAFLSMLRNPVRTILTAAAMIAAASVVSWLVAGYDAMFSQNNPDPEKIDGRFDLLLAAPESVPALDANLVKSISAAPEISFVRIVYLPVRVNAQGTRSRGGRGGNRRVPGGRPAALPADTAKNSSAFQLVLKSGEAPGLAARGPRGRGGMRGGELAPVVYGLPTGGGYALQGIDAALPPWPLREGDWLDPLAAENTDTGSIPAVLTESAAKRIGVRLGESFRIASNAGFFTLNAQGILEDGPDSRKLAVSQPGFRMRISGMDGIFVLPDDAAEISGGTPGISTVLFTLKTPESLPEFLRTHAPRAKMANAYLAGSNELKTALRKRAPDGGRGGGMAQAWSATGMSMLVSFFIIFTTLSMGVEERVRQFAILRTVALKRTQIACVVLFESMFFGAIGWIGGLASGFVLLHVLARSGGTAGLSLKIGFWTVLLTGVCSMTGAAAAAIAPIIRAMRIKPLDALAPALPRESAAPSRRCAFAGLLLIAVNPLIVSLDLSNESLHLLLYALIGCPAMTIGFACLTPAVARFTAMILTVPLAFLFRLDPAFLRSQFHANFWRITGSVLSLSAGLGFFMMILIWSASMLIPYIPGAWMPDLFVSITPGGLAPAAMEKIRAFPGVNPEQCQPIAVEQVKLAEDLTDSASRQSAVRQDNVVMCGVNPAGYAGESPLFPFRFLSGNREEALRKLASGGNYCLIPECFANVAKITENGVRRKIRVGDSFEVVAPGPDTKRVRFHVAGIIAMPGWHWFSKMSGTRRNFGRTAAMLFGNYRDIASAFHLDRVNYIWLNYAKTGADEQELLRNFRALAANAAGETFHAIGMTGESTVGHEAVKFTSKAALNHSLSGRTAMMVDGMLRMPLLILLAVSISVANTALASVRARRREVGIMRAVGLSAWGLFRLILAESLLIGAAAVLLSLAFGIGSGLCSAQMASVSSFFGGMGWAFDIPWTRIADGALFTFALCLAASLIPAILAAHANPLKLLQDGMSQL